ILAESFISMRNLLARRPNLISPNVKFVFFKYDRVEPVLFAPYRRRLLAHRVLKREPPRESAHGTREEEHRSFAAQLGQAARPHILKMLACLNVGSGPNVVRPRLRPLVTPALVSRVLAAARVHGD